MASYAIFNYQFAKIIKRTKEGSLFPVEEAELSADEAFPKRQEILDEIIRRDFQKEEQDIIQEQTKYG